MNKTTEAPVYYQGNNDTYNVYERDLGITAVTLCDYQSEGSGAISFDPDDIITNVEMIGDIW